MSKCTDFPFFDPALDEDYVSELLRIAAPDRETFLALCVRDINAGYEAEVYEAARRLFVVQASKVHRRPCAGPAVVLRYSDGSDSEAS